MPGAEPVGDLPSAPPDEFKQRLRMRRFLLASLISVLYLLVLAIFSTQDKVDRKTLIETCVIVGALFLVFSLVFRSGLNLHFADPSLTLWQLLAAVFTMLFVVYRSPDTRLAFTAFFFVGLMFGMLRMSSRGSDVTGSAVDPRRSRSSSGCATSNKRDVENLRLDALLCAVMAVTFPWFVYFGERIKRLQRGLTEASIELEDIEETAWRDELTGVYNRRALNVALDEAKQRADATGEPMALCVIDLDHFKRFNDELGHLAGDDVLRVFAHAVQGGHADHRRVRPLRGRGVHPDSAAYGSTRCRDRSRTAAPAHQRDQASGLAPDRPPHDFHWRRAVPARREDHADLCAGRRRAQSGQGRRPQPSTELVRTA